MTARRSPEAAPLALTAGDLQAARRALAEPERPRVRARRVLLCAVVMTSAALALCAVVVLGGEPTGTAPATSVRAALR